MTAPSPPQSSGTLNAQFPSHLNRALPWAGISTYISVHLPASDGLSITANGRLHQGNVWASEDQKCQESGGVHGAFISDTCRLIKVFLIIQVIDKQFYLDQNLEVNKSNAQYKKCLSLAVMSFLQT